MGKNNFSLEDFQKIVWDYNFENEKDVVIEKNIIDENVNEGITSVLKEEFDKNEKKAKIPEEPKTKKSVKLNKPQTVVHRYTIPKERGIIARIINRLKYEHDWYEDIETYLDDNYYACHDLEMFRVSNNRKEQRFYKRVQAYEDAEEDVAMKRIFMTLRVTAAVAMLSTSVFAVKMLADEVEKIVSSSGYVAQAEEKLTLTNANEGQIKYAEIRAAKIEYDFKYISYNEILDTIIRTSSEVSRITENRAMGTMKNIGENSDQKLLESILREGYEADYDTFSDEKKQELKQLIYEMLDEKIKVWIRNPEKVKEIMEEKEKNNSEVTEGEYEK